MEMQEEVGRMPRNVKAGLEHIPTRMAMTGDRRKLAVMRATEEIPAGLDKEAVLAVWFMKGWRESTVMVRTVKLVEHRMKTGCGLMFVGLHRRQVPKDLGDQVELFVN